MIKYTGTRDGRPFVALCLEAGNVERLMDGKPIVVDGREIRMPFDIMIDYAPTQDAMVEKLRALGVPLPPEKDWKR